MMSESQAEIWDRMIEEINGEMGVQFNLPDAIVDVMKDFWEKLGEWAGNRPGQHLTTEQNLVMANWMNIVITMFAQTSEMGCGTCANRQVGALLAVHSRYWNHHVPESDAEFLAALQMGVGEVAAAVEGCRAFAISFEVEDE